ncbi:MAG: hypothetical protein ABEJ68_07645 [Halobacteriaceae archaeon]
MSGPEFVRASALYDAREGVHTLAHVEMRADYAIAATPEVRRL